MNNSRIFLLIVSFIVFLLLQILVLKNLVLFGTAFCFLYVLYILLLPIEIKTVPTLIIAFVLGMGIDLFYDTLGVHTASILAVAFVRRRWIKMITPRGGYDDDLQPSVLNMGFGWFFTYSIPLVLLHHIFFFYIDNLGTGLFLFVVQKIVASAIFVFIMSIIVQLLFYRRRRGI
ncbi:rod shape-determining protein MreD [Rhodonellum sp.]|uniref:rod shape-determining protein MreD n=1 Tax=Rhodonellum sp. TaxID=2231180 RepID=UPI0027213280|nr:rod shape-determining protein MreD [Rhodonellum sp.]MDO9552385.1 rod shape-determining protein MreD [Rhodonellum sp.]